MRGTDQEDRMAISRFPWILWGIEIVAFVICCLVVWRLVEERVTVGDSYIAQSEDFVITPLPQWIRTDLKRQVLQNASLDGGVSILDDDLVHRVADAFPMHPWVESVARVHKEHPARVVVDLIYRQPVAMVVVPGGLYAVDVHGVVLPSEDFTGEVAARYPRIDGMTVPPRDQVGDPWGDARVEAACRVAAILREQWNGWGLAKIVPAQDSRPEAEPTFDVVTRGGHRIAWGSAPSLESLQNPAVEPRMDQLAKIAAEQGSLDVEAAGRIDLTRGPDPLGQDDRR